MFRNSLPGVLSGLLSVAMLSLWACELAAQPSEAVVIPTAYEPMWGIFHKNVIASRPLTGGSYYDVSSEIEFRSITASSGDSEMSADVNAISLYDDVEMLAPWETELSALNGLTGTQFSVNGKLVVTGSGLPFETLKQITVPAAGVVSSPNARILSPGDSMSHYVSYFTVRVLESAVFHAKGGGCTSVEFLLYNSSTDTWDSIDVTPMDDDLDMTGVAGVDFSFDRFEYPEWVVDLGGNKFGPKLKIVSHFSDETSTELIKNVPIWQILGSPSGPGI